MIFNRVIGASFERLGDFRPAIAVLCVRDDQLTVLVCAPLLALDLRVEVVVPSLAALLPDSPRKLARDFGPSLRPEFGDELDDSRVLLRGPRPFHQFGVEHFLPPVQALHVGAAIAKVHRCARRENTNSSSVTVKHASNHTNTVLVVRTSAKEHDINRRARASRRSFTRASPRDRAVARVPIFFQFLPPYTATAPRNNSSYERNHPTSVSFAALFHRKRRIRVA